MTPVPPSGAAGAGWRPSLPPWTTALRAAATARRDAREILERGGQPGDATGFSIEEQARDEDTELDVQLGSEASEFLLIESETDGQPGGRDPTLHLLDQRRQLRAAVLESGDASPDAATVALQRLRLPPSALCPGSHASCELLYRFTEAYARIGSGAIVDDFAHLLFLADKLSSRHTEGMTAEALACDGSERLALCVRGCLELVSCTMVGNSSWMNIRDLISCPWPPTGSSGLINQFSSAKCSPTPCSDRSWTGPSPGPAQTWTTSAKRERNWTPRADPMGPPASTEMWRCKTTSSVPADVSTR